MGVVKVFESLPKNVALIVQIVVFAISLCKVVSCDMPIDIELSVVLI